MLESGPVGVVAERLPLKVFINYRREDTHGLAWGLYWPLALHFGSDNVFLDNGALRGGDEWLAEIKGRIAEADVFLALVGERWQEKLDQRDREQAKDYVATEIQLALLRTPALKVIAVVIDGANAPRAMNLPNALKGLAEKHVERIRQMCLREDVGPLIARLCEIAEEAGKAVPPPESDLLGPPAPVALGQDQEGAHGYDQPAGDEVLGAEDLPLPEVPGGSQTVQLPEEFPRRRRLVPARVAPAPDEEHFAELVDEARDPGIVVFVGAGINSEESANLPDDESLARFLSAKVGLERESADLAEVAQATSALKGSQRMFQLIREGLPLEPAPGRVHRYLAGLPKRLAQPGHERHPQMIVTPKYDAALEHALKDAREPFDVLVYMGPATESPGKWVHIKWELRQPVPIPVANEYQGLPIRGDTSLERTVIVRINGSVNDPDVNLMWDNNYVVTEDHFIQYLSGSTPTSLVPGQLLAKLRSASYLFLGYTLSDWRLRVFLRRLWPGERMGDAPRWAIERSPNRLEAKLWFDAGINLYQSSLSEYIDGLDRFLQADASR